MKISLFLDEDSQDLNLIRALRARSVDLISCAEAGRNGYTDAEQLAWATAHGRVLFSYNTQDFMRLHKHYLTQGLSHAGMILANNRSIRLAKRCAAC